MRIEPRSGCLSNRDNSLSSIYFADLHSHTTASDGLDEPAALLQRAQAAGLRALAICDHDSIAGYLEAERDQSASIGLIPGIELSANIGEDEVHVLGYYINPDSRQLISALAELQHRRIARMERFAAKLTDLGLPLTFEEVAAQASGESIGRPHVARAMIARGYVTSVDEAFDKFLAAGRPAFVLRTDTTPEWCIDLIHRAGGVACLAHPFTIAEPFAMIERLIAAGLDGIEVEYGAYDRQQRLWLRQVADEFGLLRSGGSDFHGESHRENAPLGSGGVSLAELEELKIASTAYSGKRL